MHNLSTILRKFTEITKTLAGNLVDKNGNVPRRGPKPMFSDVEVIALSMTQEYQGIDSENMLFHQNIHQPCFTTSIITYNRQLLTSQQLKIDRCIHSVQRMTHLSTLDFYYFLHDSIFSATKIRHFFRFMRKML